MEYKYYDSGVKRRLLLTLNSISETIENLIDWNKKVESIDDYYSSPGGMQLLAANCTLITAIGEGINRINRLIPDFLNTNFPQIPWIDIIGMRNRIAHGYFELDAAVVLNAIKKDIPPLQEVVNRAFTLIQSESEGYKN
ncbi:MAG: DUF86 domain-containing protein [Muribaculaceae bacterium]|nr:DUF86 domain-containing protein [Muribaculaceae bacterium]